jgi:hypothetical protein
MGSRLCSTALRTLASTNWEMRSSCQAIGVRLARKETARGNGRLQLSVTRARA